MKKKILKLFIGSYFSLLLYKYHTKSSSLKIDYNHEKLNHIIKLNPSLSKKVYYPSFFFPFGNVQTVLLLVVNAIEKSFKIFSYKNYSKTRKIIKAEDEENIYVDFYEKSFNLDDQKDNFENFKFLNKFDNSNILVIIAGACGRSGEFYITDVMERFLAEHFKCIVINHRGILKYPLQKSKLYHCGYTDDIKDVFEFLKMNVKGSKYYLLGFSMGGNIVTKFIGEIGDKADYYNIHGGVSICGPLNLKSFTDMTENQSKFKIYSKVFCKNLKSVFYRNAEYLLRDLKSEDKVELLKSIKSSTLSSEYYRNYIIKSFGYKSQEEYFHKASGCTYLKNIKVPFLCLFAEDDPLIPHNCLDSSGYELNDNFVLAKTSSGGHVGFFKGLYFKRWIYEPIIEFIRDLSKL